MPVSSKEIHSKLLELRERSELLLRSFSIVEKRSRLEELNAQINSPELWSDTAKMANLNKEKRLLENDISLFGGLEEKIDELAAADELLESLADSGSDDSLAAEAEKLLSEIDKILNEMEFRKMLGGKTDPLNAIISINAGAGGRESQDWAVMLWRMYTRWCERRGYSVEVVDKVTGDDATAIKNVTFIASGDFAYGYLKAETGVHRLVRISPFDANKRRHTSFASVFVTPEIDDSIEIEIDEKDLKIDTYRSGGAASHTCRPVSSSSARTTGAST